MKLILENNDFYNYLVNSVDNSSCPTYSNFPYGFIPSTESTYVGDKSGAVIIIVDDGNTDQSARSRWLLVEP